MLSNRTNRPHDLSIYALDPAVAATYAIFLCQEPLARQIERPVTEVTIFIERHPQDLQRLQDCLMPALPAHRDWLARRGVDYPAHSVVGLEDFEQVDLFIIPFDHVVLKHGFRPVDGPAFPDYREGRLAGICIRNVSTDQEFAADAKYTFSNYGWFLWGWDDCDPSKEVVLCEGVFDAIALRKLGHQAIAFGSAYPTPQQLAMVAKRFPKRIACFDNDFWGWYGAYVTCRCLGCEAFLPTGKDVAEQMERGVADLVGVGPEFLAGLVVEAIPGYNTAAAAGRLVRTLPYNK